MITDPILPVIDLMPLPAPYWLFKLLLLVTFILHIIAMNLMFGSGMIAVATRWFAPKSEFTQRLFWDISKKIPTFLAATVTLGVAPLLFLQVIYGQFFYTSSVLIAWPWFLVVVLLVAAYYGFYGVAFAKNLAAKKTGWVLLLSVCLIFFIGFFYSNNMTLMLTPAKWAALYHGDPSGWNLNWSEATLIPRYLHFFIAAMAVGGLLLAVLGFSHWRQERDYARFLLTTGGKWFVHATSIQILIGIWFLFRLPKEKMLLGLGGNLLATACLGIGFICGLIAILVMSRACHTSDPRRGALVAILLTGVVIISMAIWRDVLRTAYLAPFFKGSELAVKTQVDVLALFLVLFVLGILLWLWMLRKYFLRPASDISK